jgi:hypothetical protein
MTLVTLSGTPSVTDINNNFNDKVADIKAVNQISSDGKGYEIMLDVTSLTSSYNLGLRSATFTPPDDIEIEAVKLIVSSVNNGINVSVSLSPILPDTEEVVSKYVVDTSVSMTDVTAGGAGFNKYLTPAAKVFLVKGITYRLEITSDSASVVKRAICSLICKVRRRRN